MVDRILSGFKKEMAKDQYIRMVTSNLSMDAYQFELLNFIKHVTEEIKICFMPRKLDKSMKSTIKLTMQDINKMLDFNLLKSL